MSGSTFNRFLGGSPIAVLLRLALVSLVVGALMSWLDIDALRLLAWVERSVSELWATGFEALRQLGRYLLAGAALVVPVWLLTRLFSLGDLRRSTDARWGLPGATPNGPEPRRRGEPFGGGPA